MAILVAHSRRSDSRPAHDDAADGGGGAAAHLQRPTIGQRDEMEHVGGRCSTSDRHVLLHGRGERGQAMRLVDVRHAVFSNVARDRVELGLLAAMDGRGGAVLLHVRRVHRGGDVGHVGGQVRQEDNILRVGGWPIDIRGDGSVDQRLLRVPRLEVRVRHLRLGRRLHNWIRADDGAGRRDEEDRLRDDVPPGVRRRFHAGGRLGSGDQGPNVAADRVRPSQRAARRPLVADGRVAAVALGAGSRHRGGGHRAKRLEDERRRQRRGHRRGEAARREEGQPRRGEETLARCPGSLQNAEPTEEDVERLFRMVRQFHRLLRPVLEHWQPRRQSVSHAVPQRPGRAALVPAHVLPDGPQRSKVRGQHVHADRRRLLHRRVQHTHRRRSRRRDDRHDRPVRQGVHRRFVRRHLQLHGRTVPDGGEEHRVGHWVHVRAFQRRSHADDHAARLAEPEGARRAVRLRRARLRFLVAVPAGDGEPTDARDDRGR